MKLLGPDDGEIERFLNETKDTDLEELQEFLGDMLNTISETEANQEPRIFAYGKLWNFLKGPEISNAMKTKLLAAAIWELTNGEQNGKCS